VPLELVTYREPDPAPQPEPEPEPERWQISAVVMLGVNLLPLLGVAFWNWQVRDIVFLYWAENLAVGVFNQLRILCVVEGPANRVDIPIPYVLRKVAMAMFAGVNFFGFCVIHGIFVMILFFGLKGGAGHDVANIGTGFGMFVAERGAWLALAVLFVGQAWQFFSAYLGRGENRRAQLTRLLFQPYGRILVIHTFLIAGSFVLANSGTPVELMLIFVVLKIVADILFYRLDRTTSSAQPAARSESAYPLWPAP